MSRIGNKSILLPAKVSLEISKDNVVTVKGPKGTLSQKVEGGIEIVVEGNEVTFKRPDEQKNSKSLHGLYRSLINNMVIGVSEGFKTTLEIIGVGYKATCVNNVLEFSLGYSHSIFFALPPEVTATAVTEKGKNPMVTIEGIDKQLVGQIIAKIKSFRKVEPYKGKGVRTLGEQVRRKAGKTSSKK